MRRLFGVLRTAAVVALATGCSDGALEGDPSGLEGTDGVQAVSEQYLQGIADGDGPMACSLLDAPSQRALIAAQGVSGSCLDAVEAASKSLSADEQAALRNAEIAAVEADGDVGSAEVDLSERVEAVTGLVGGRISLDRTEKHWGITLPIAGTPVS